MESVWVWLDNWGWEALVIWCAASIIVGLITGRFLRGAEPTDEGPESLEGYHDRVTR